MSNRILALDWKRTDAPDPRGRHPAMVTYRATLHGFALSVRGRQGGSSWKIRVANRAGQVVGRGVCVELSLALARAVHYVAAPVSC